MPYITDVYWDLWYGAVYVVAIGGAWFAVTVVIVVLRLLRRPARAGARAITTRHPDLEDDPQLHRFFAKVNRAYRRRPPGYVEAPLPSVSLRAPVSGRTSSETEPAVVEPPLDAGQAIPDSSVLHSAPFHSPRPMKASSARPPTKPLRRPDQLQVFEHGLGQEDLMALANLWPRLSAKDRRELLALARIKADAGG